MSIKPPAGVVPKHIHDLQRADDLREAIVRYALAAMTPPTEWLDELEELYKLLRVGGDTDD